ncbi:hypothetical protein CHU92_09040 [Flavobacterium cyanobacteriorum]|uniref:Secretion system C-terminal sorting domain-containing protein n=1 Tax=Flavobacterium cyanobacteriorum TaxID=2022802 RepID=A0A255Z601_9FLAO|nr:T9SS type A sorting domain-containing protein [Flavobacterium cyanobacteriorum]OYQ36886.1 hypothetical protein CHU92_09040 [Flavobacterium cyanobacteriorum]
MKTTDGGTTWEVIPITMGTTPNFMKFISDQVGYFTTITNGRIFRTTDGGNTWNLVHQENNTALTTISIVNNNLFIGGYSDTSTTCNTFFKKSTDGISWSKECYYFPFPEPSGIYSAYFLSETKAFWGVNGGLLRYEATANTEEYQKVNIQLYPNPVKDLVQVKIGENGEYYNFQLYDINGRFIKNGNSAVPTNLEGMAAGLYILKIPELNIVYKILKE